jgi:hypothetical protein
VTCHICDHTSLPEPPEELLGDARAFYYMHGFADGVAASRMGMGPHLCPRHQQMQIDELAARDIGVTIKPIVARPPAKPPMSVPLPVGCDPVSDKESTDGGGWVMSLSIVVAAVGLGALIGGHFGAHNAAGAVFGGSIAATVMGLELWRQRSR